MKYWQQGDVLLRAVELDEIPEGRAVAPVDGSLILALYPLLLRLRKFFPQRCKFRIPRLYGRFWLRRQVRIK